MQRVASPLLHMTHRRRLPTATPKPTLTPGFRHCRGPKGNSGADGGQSQTHLILKSCHLHRHVSSQSRSCYCTPLTRSSNTDSVSRTTAHVHRFSLVEPSIHLRRPPHLSMRISSQNYLFCVSLLFPFIHVRYLIGAIADLTLYFLESYVVGQCHCRLMLVVRVVRGMEGRRAVGDRGRCFWFWPLLSFRFVSFQRLLYGLLRRFFSFFSFQFLFAGILSILCRFGGACAVPFDRFCGSPASSGWSERFDPVSLVRFFEEFYYFPTLRGVILYICYDLFWSVLFFPPLPLSLCFLFQPYCPAFFHSFFEGSRYGMR